MDVQTLRRVLHDFIRFNPKDFTIKGSPTSHLISVNRQSTSDTWFPWKVYKTDPPSGSDTTTPQIYVAVNLDSWLLTDPGDPSSFLHIKNQDDDADGLGDDDDLSKIQLKVGDRVWLHIDLTPMFDTTGKDTTPLAYVEFGPKWDSDGGDAASVFPATMKWNTDDGSYTGSDGGNPPGTPPANTQQTDIFVPIGYVETDAVDTFGLIDAGRALALGTDAAKNNLFFIQQLRTNLMFGQACADEDNNDQANFQYVVAWPLSAQPDV